MKGSTQLGLVGACVALVFFAWRQHPEKRRVAPLSSNSDFSSVPAAPLPPLPVQSPLLAAPPLPPTAPSFDPATVHLKLRQWRAAQAADSEEEQNRLMKELLSLVKGENAGEILQSLSPEELETPFSVAVLRRWMQVSPALATNWVSTRADSPENSLMAAAAEEWANNKPELLNYLNRIPDTPWKQNFINAAGLELSSKDPHGAIDLAQHMRAGDEQTHLLQAVVCDWISREPTAALNWVIDVHEPVLREQLTAAAAKSYALVEPNLAADWLITTVRSEELRKEAVLNIVETWGARSPENAAKWVTASLDGSTRKAAAEIVSQHWMQTDSAAAKAWLQSLPIERR